MIATPFFIILHSNKNERRGIPSPFLLFKLTLSNGKLLITPNHAYIGPNKIDLAKDTDTVYVHPTTNNATILTPTHPQFNAVLQVK